MILYKKICFIALREDSRADLRKVLCHRQSAMSFLLVLMVNETAIVVKQTTTEKRFLGAVVV